MSPADVAAHRAASYIRPSANWGICPECNGNLGPNHVCPSRTVLRLETELAYLLRDRQYTENARREIAEHAA
ncbi:hypothetical protein OG552_10630 [Streptomyces sp. NBC_01476]|uniref:hypothetical protein n=1 Tax=Streptomyces sp. NBC_01476 TaxID=2903881 RepID=UPI002E356EBA|nr:hypothetical protein [Streptomyces sp. NBC_01476]